MPATSSSAPWWRVQPPQATPDSACATGLTQREARLRLQRDGPNLPGPTRQRPLLLQFLARLGNPLVLILLAASAVSALTRELSNFLMISAMVLLSVTLDFMLEYRANAAADRLRGAVGHRATVLRDGQAAAIPARELVCGDIVLVRAGDLIPADGWVLQANDLYVDQAALTGESYPVEKRTCVGAEAAAELQAASAALFTGSSVISGSARMQVSATGSATVLGDIAQRVAAAPAPTSFDTGLRRFGMLIMRLTFLMVLFVLLVNTLFHRAPLDAFLFAVALAVGLTPELLPMVVSVTLARGAVRMAAQGMIVKRMSAIQDLGSMDVLCTDKTGTLTEARVQLACHVDAQGVSSERVLELAYLNSIFETGLKSPLDEAILAHQKLDIAHWRKVDELPFDFQRRRVSVLIDNGEARWLVLKGAADEIAGLCTHYEQAGSGQQRLDPVARTCIGARYRALEAQGLRVLGIAWRPVARTHAHAVSTDEAGLVLAGFAAFHDPPKHGAAGALASLQQLRVTIKVITGDSEAVTRHVCAQLGLPLTGIVTGQQIVQMDDLALAAAAQQANLFCHVAPIEKNRIILALKARGHVVGYLGDGINDAPSLHSADVGVSVDSAVDVAREAADMIMLAPDLRVLHAAVLEGRRTFGNIMKYIAMATSANFGNMLSMAAASLFLPFLPMLPAQILLNNILYDLSQMTIPLDQVDAASTCVPRVLDLHAVRSFMLVLGTLSSLFDALAFYLLLVVLHADETHFRSGWFVASLCTQVLVIFVLRTRGNPLRSRPHPLLASSSLAAALAALALPYTALGSHFALVPLPPLYYALLGTLVAAYLLCAQGVKQYLYRRTGA